MPGKWIERHVDKHFCDPPQSPTNVTTGDIWQCDICQSALTVKVNPDQRDGPYLTYTNEDGSAWSKTQSVDMRSTTTRPTPPPRTI